MRISDWSSDVCSSDLCATQRAAREVGGVGDDRLAHPNGVGDAEVAALVFHRHHAAGERRRLEEVVEAEEVGEAEIILGGPVAIRIEGDGGVALVGGRPVVEDGETVAALQLDLHARSEEHTSELQSLMRTSYAGFY